MTDSSADESSGEEGDAYVYLDDQVYVYESIISASCDTTMVDDATPRLKYTYMLAALVCVYVALVMSYGRIFAPY